MDEMNKLRRLAGLPIPESRDPELQYDEKKVRDVVEKVTVTLKGSKSAAASKLASRYRKLHKQLEILDHEKKELNKMQKDMFDSLFDATDEIYTRVIDTVSMVMTLSKRGERQDIQFDREAFLDEIASTLPDLSETVQLVLDKHTHTSTTKISPRLGKPKFKDPSMNEDDTDIDKEIMSSLARFDAKMAAIKTRHSA